MERPSSDKNGRSALGLFDRIEGLRFGDLGSRTIHLVHKHCELFAIPEHVHHAFVAVWGRYTLNDRFGRDETRAQFVSISWKHGTAFPLEGKGSLLTAAALNRGGKYSRDL